MIPSRFISKVSDALFAVAPDRGAFWWRREGDDVVFKSGRHFGSNTVIVSETEHAGRVEDELVTEVVTTLRAPRAIRGAQVR